MDLKAALVKFWQDHPRLSSIPGPYFDDWNKDLFETEHAAFWFIPGGDYSRYFATTRYLDRQQVQFTVWCDTEARADEVRLLLQTEFDFLNSDVPEVDTDHLLYAKRVGNVLVRHQAGNASSEDRDGERGGELADVWRVDGTWLFIVAGTLGVN